MEVHSRCVHSLVAGEADRKVAALQAAQSARWEEFCRMADRWNIASDWRMMLILNNQHEEPEL